MVRLIKMHPPFLRVAALALVMPVLISMSVMAEDSKDPAPSINEVAEAVARSDGLSYRYDKDASGKYRRYIEAGGKRFDITEIPLPRLFSEVRTKYGYKTLKSGSYSITTSWGLLAKSGSEENPFYDRTEGIEERLNEIGEDIRERGDDACTGFECDIDDRMSTSIVSFVGPFVSTVTGYDSSPISMKAFDLRTGKAADIQDFLDASSLLTALKTNKEIHEMVEKSQLEEAESIEQFREDNPGVSVREKVDWKPEIEKANTLSELNNRLHWAISRREGERWEKELSNFAASDYQPEENLVTVKIGLAMGCPDRREEAYTEIRVKVPPTPRFKAILDELMQGNNLNKDDTKMAKEYWSTVCSSAE